MGIQLLSSYTWLDDDIQILGVNFQNLVHLLKIDANSAVERTDLSFKRSTGAIGDDRHLVTRAGADHILNFVSTEHSNNCIGWRRGMKGFIFPKSLTHRMGNR